MGAGLLEFAERYCCINFWATFRELDGNGIRRLVRKRFVDATKWKKED